ncbi:MAG: hypothetical protein Q7U55_10995, partial [Deltaproteobacteria bacterium]|nr:hypothetical protein [Deltaproteobacteria bacterium]
MEIIEIEAYYLPPHLRDRVKGLRTEVYQDEKIRIDLKIPSIDDTFVKMLTQQLKKNRERYLAHLPIEKIVHVLDEASRRWLDKNY